MQKLSLNKDNTKILVCCHKPSDLPKNDLFLPIHVGAAISDKSLNIQRDDQVNGSPCDNISNQNKSYCECTSMYWAWKNIKKIYPNIQYIGLNHYRRFFDLDGFSFRIANYKSENDVGNYKLNERKLSRLLNKGYTIIAEPNIYPYSIGVDYSVCHISEDFHTIEKIIHEKYPDYDDVVYDFFYKNNKLSHYNMFVTSYSFFNDYCDWLFSILQEAEKRIDISNYNDVQKRIWGYLAERLFNVYCIKNNTKLKRVPLFVYNNKKESYFHYLLNRLRYNLAFIISKRIH